MGQLLIFLILLFFSFSFSGLEAALFSTLRAEIERFKGKFLRQLINEMKEKESITLLTLLVGNTIVNAYAASIFSAMFSEKVKFIGFSPAFKNILEITVFTLIILIFGELSPKLISIRYHNFMVKSLSGLIFPFFYTLNILSSIFPLKNKGFPRAPSEDEEIMDELEELALGADPALKSRISLLHLKTQDVMTPVEKVVCLKPETTIAEFREILNKTRHSNYPVVKDHEILGVVNIYDGDLIKADPEEKVEKFISDAPRVLSTLSVVKILREYRDKDFFLIIDEYGNFLGIITLKDILARLFPEISIKWLDKKKLIVPGDILTSDLEVVLGRTLAYDMPTLQAIIMEKTGRIPEEGEKIDLDDFSVEILEKEYSKLKKVMIEIK
ncbi:MAG: CNNM domain-containing protein [Candidatus Hydrothermia bacterium]